MSVPRRVAPSGWTQHVPFGMFLIDLLRPALVVELGTHYGVSYCAFCQAVQELGTNTRCYAVDTWRGDEQAGVYGPAVLEDLRQNHDPVYGHFSRLIQSTFDEALSQFDDGTVDLLHVDGFHSYQAARHDFETWLPKLSDRGVVLLHDTNVRAPGFGVWKLWEELTRHYPHFALTNGHGLGLLAVGPRPPEQLAQLIGSSERQAGRLRAFFCHLGAAVEATQHLHVALRETADQQFQTLTTIRHELEQVLPDRDALRRLAAAQSDQQQALVGLGDELRRGQQETKATLGEMETWLRAVLKHGQGDKAGAEALAVDAEYRSLVRRVRGLVEATLPSDVAVLVVSKGDEGLLDLGADRKAAHFPQDRDGNYAGFNPADCGSAIVHLEALRARGAEYLLLPSTSLWWLDHYKGLRRHLDRHYRLLLRENDVCAIYSLAEPPAAGVAAAAAGLAEIAAEFERRFERRPAVLDWDTGVRLAAAFPELMVFAPPGGCAPARLPYLDKTIDLVVVASADPAVAAEAERVADAGVVVFSSDPAAESAAPRVRWLREATAPPAASVSVVIPSYNGAALTEACLNALAETLPCDFRGEVIVVDDCSSDDTGSRLAGWLDRHPRMKVKVLRNAQNSGFLTTCNNGAAAATGDYVVLMNNDTLPQRGWLEPLLRTFRDYPDAGAVGCKLVYPDGRLQEAGGVVFEDGTAANFGKFDYQLDLPLYNHVREVDYVTGALIMTPRALFNELGGLDTRYRPIYYEETDYCFRLRDRGYKVYYQPQSVVIHLEGVTCGTDTGSGQKRYQVVNREKFVDRWRHALRRQPPGPGKFDRMAWHRLAVRDACAGETAADAGPHAGSNGGGRR